MSEHKVEGYPLVNYSAVPEEKGEGGDPELVESKISPMSPSAASAAIINLLIATGPFGYPYGFVHLGPVISLTLLCITTCASYITTNYVVEVLATGNALMNEKNERYRSGTVYPKKVYKNESDFDKMNAEDQKIKGNIFYMRKKIEYSTCGLIFYGNGLKIFVVLMILVYMYGAIALKYVSGAESFEYAVSFIVYKDVCGWRKAWFGAFDPYYFGLFAFVFFSCAFSFGNIDNSKMVQIVSLYLRFFTTALLIIGSIIIMARHGINTGPVFDFKMQLPFLANVFGNTTFAFIF